MINDPILVKLSNSYGYCAVSTYTRRDRGHGRFLISKEILEKAMEGSGGRLFHDTDCANIVQLWRDEDTVVMMLFWLSVCSDGKVNGLRQRIAVPIDKLKRVLETKESVRMLYRMSTGRAAIDHRPAAEVIRSKQTLLKKALATDDLSIQVDEEKVVFPWFTIQDERKSAEEVDAYTRLVLALARKALTQTRVSSEEKLNPDERLGMRLYLINLGFIGDEYKSARAVLMRNFSGSNAAQKFAEDFNLAMPEVHIGGKS